MPYEPIIRWIALGLLGLGVAWIIIDAIGLRPRAIRVRRAIRRAGSASLLCGACGHPAVSLGAIDTCPECGARYAEVGLDGRASGSRWSTPLFLVLVLLVGAWALGSMLLAPIAAAAANRATIGQTHVRQSWVKVGYIAGPHSGSAGPSTPTIIELSRRVNQPDAPTTPWPGAILPGSSVSVRLVCGPRAQAAMGLGPASWSRQGSTSGYALAGAASPAASTPTVSPWEPFLSTPPAVTLSWSMNSSAWNVHDSSGAVLASGLGVDKGLAELFERGGMGERGPYRGAQAEAAREALTELAAWAGSVSGSNDFLVRSVTPAPLVRVGALRADPTIHLYHPSAPWGLTAAIGTWALLLLVALVVLAIAWRSRRRNRRSTATAG